MKDVYKLTVFGTDEKIRVPSLLDETTIGYFSSLSAVEDYIRTPRGKAASRWYFSEEVRFRVFEAKKYIADSDEEQQGQWVYDGNGMLYGGYEGSDRDKFQGRTPDQCLFKPGDLIGFLQGKRLNAGIVAGRPVYREETIPYLDQSDDCYMVLTLNKITGKRGHSHPWVHHVFAMEEFMSVKVKERLKGYYDEGRL